MLRSVADVVYLADFSSTPEATSMDEFVCEYHDLLMGLHQLGGDELASACVTARPVLPGVICVTAKSQVSDARVDSSAAGCHLIGAFVQVLLASMFLRVQEYYECPDDDIRRHAPFCTAK